MKPKVLIFIDWFSPGYRAGGPTTSNVNIVAHLSKLFDFYVITSDTDYHATEPYQGIVPDCWTERDGCKVWYCSKFKSGLDDIERAAALAQCDVWYVNGIYSRRFSLNPVIAARKLKPRKLIVSARGMLSPHALAVKPYIKYPYLLAMRLSGLYKNVVWHGTNEAECAHIVSRFGHHAQTVAIANLPRKVSDSFLPSLKHENQLKLVSFARVSPEKNTLYAIKALSTCRSTVHYDIYGQINSDSYWVECQREIANLPDNVTVVYKGSVDPSQLSKLYEQYDALYLPTTGENFGHAILESFINCRPVIISDRTPWRSLERLNVGFDLSLDDPTAFAKAIDMLASETDIDFEVRCASAHQYAKKISHETDTLNDYNRLLR